MDETTPALRITVIEALCVKCGRRSWRVPGVDTVRVCPVCQGYCQGTGRFQVAGNLPYDGKHRACTAGPSLMQSPDMEEVYRLRI